MAWDRFWFPVFTILPVGRPEYESSGQSCPAAERMDDRIACEVQEAQVGEPAAAPYPGPDYRVDDKSKYKGKQNKG